MSEATDEEIIQSNGEEPSLMIKLPKIKTVEIELSEEPPEALFDSTLDFAEATDRLKSHKRWENQK